MDIEAKIKEIENNLKPYETDYLNITCKIVGLNSIDIFFEFSKLFKNPNEKVKEIVKDINKKFNYDIKAVIDSDNGSNKEIIDINYLKTHESNVYRCEYQILQAGDSNGNNK